MRRYSVILEPVHESGFEGYYYAHFPTLDLTTQGLGVEGALRAGRELVEAWVAEKQAHGERVPEEGESFMTHIEVGDALFGA